MIDPDLLDKFDSIEDLPVSEETLAAYLEGNLDFVDSCVVVDAISSDDTLESVMSELSVDGISSVDWLCYSGFGMDGSSDVDMLLTNSASFSDSEIFELSEPDQCEPAAEFSPIYEDTVFTGNDPSENNLSPDDIFDPDGHSLESDTSLDDDLINDQLLN